MIDLTACYMNDLKILRGQSIKSNDMRKNIEEEEEKRYQSKKRAQDMIQLRRTTKLSSLSLFFKFKNLKNLKGLKILNG